MFSSGNGSKAAIGRRRFLRNSAAGVAAVAVGGPLLAACGGDSGGGSTGKARAERVTMPAYVPVEGAEPDVPGTKAGVPPLFLAYPKDRPRSVEKKPLDGEKLTAAGLVFAAVPPKRAKNPHWQAVEKALGGTVDWTVIPASDYDTKFNTLVAGGRLPDVFQPASVIDDRSGFLEATCEDLTPHLSGGKVKAYPNLANIPTVAWETGTDHGKLYGLPIPRNLTGGSGFYRHDLFAKAGVEELSQLKDTDQLADLLKEVTSPKSKQWGMVTSTGTVFNMQVFGRLFGVPYNWTVDEATGKFTKNVETEEYRAVVEYLVTLHKAGVFYPGSEGFTGEKRGNVFTSGRAAMAYTGLPGFGGPTGWRALAKQTDESFDVRPFVPIGDKGVEYFDNIVFATVHLKKNEKAKIEAILRMADFMAAPFGTEEYTLLNFGVEGVDHELDGKGNPVLTKKGQENLTVPWRYIAAPPGAIYDAGDPETARLHHEALADAIPKGVKDPTTGLFSPTAGEKGGSLGTALNDGVTSIIAGRKPLKELDGLIADWRKGGGDTMREEYQTAWKDLKKG